MNNIYENSIPKEDYLRGELIKFSCILDDEIFKYLLALLNLDISPLENGVFNHYKFDNYTIMTAMKTLPELKLYRDIVAFNLYHRTDRYIDTCDKHFKLVDSPFKDGVSVYYINDEKDENIVYSFTYGYDNHCTINLFEGIIQSIKSRGKGIKKKVDAILSEMNINTKIYGATNFTNSSKYLLLKNNLEMYESITISDLEKSYQKDKELSRVKKQTLDNLLDDLNLDIKDDFSVEGANLVYKKQLIKIIVHN